MSDYAKYLKYKNKYLDVKHNKQFQKGGFDCNKKIGYKNILGTCWMVAIQMIFSFGSISGHDLEKNIREMSLEDMIIRARDVPYIKHILSYVLNPDKSVYLEAILTTFIKRYKSKLWDINEIVKPLDILNEENKDRCELVILKNFKHLFIEHDHIIEINNSGGDIVEQYLFSNILSIFLLGRKTSFINYYAYHPDENKKISNLKYINYENYGILININVHVCCFFTCMGVQKYYNDTDGKTYHCQWKELLKKTTDTRCLYVREKGCVELIYDEDYFKLSDKSTLHKIESLSVLSTNQNTNSLDNDIQDYMNEEYENLLKPKTERDILCKIGNILSSYNIPDAIKYHTMASDQGSIYSQLELGRIYTHTNNIDNAIKYHTMASDQGSIYSQIELGLIYENRGDIDNAIKYYTLASDQGNINYKIALENIYKNMAI